MAGNDSNTQHDKEKTKQKRQWAMEGITKNKDLTRLPPDGGGELGAAKLLQIVILLRNGRRVNPRRDLWSPAMTIPRGHTKSKRQDRDAIGSLLDKGAGEI
ncbi:hypothetical protein RUM44_002137 [Polyplax serrata]|uniref:Uncharacterized protein n=1 Tax=Polyplax serrata TaxID=468196 RepID=A0ABR1AM49_POLSC